MEKIGKMGAEGLIIMLACCTTLLKTWKLDYDTWFILNCGRYVIETGTFPHVEFATIHENLHYIMQQWLTAIIFWKIFDNFGADGLIFFAWLIGFILMFVYYKICLYVSDGNKKVSVMLSIIICTIITLHFIDTRPQILSTLILLIEVFLLEKYFREKKIWTVCALPVLSVILINLHAAMWIMMIIVLMPFVAESFVQNLKNNPMPFSPLILTAAGIFLAGFINPYGWEAITYVFNSTSPEIRALLFEMKTPIANNFFSVAFFLFSAALIIAQCKKNFPLRYFFLSFGMMIFGFYAFRNLFLFFILATFPLAYTLKNFNPFENFLNLRHKLFILLFPVFVFEIYRVYILSENSISEMHLPTKIIFCLTIIFLACFIFFYRREGKLFSEEIFILRRKPLAVLATFQIIIFFSVISFLTPKFEYENPKPALDFLLSKNRAEDIILWTDYDYGGYAEFRGVKAYIDTRAEVFIPSNNHQKNILSEYIELITGNLDYREFFARYNFTHIFVTSENTIPYLMLSDDENFRLLFEYDLPNGRGHGKIFAPIKNFNGE